MKSNIPKHPCANKCTDFKNKQCNTCLVQEVTHSDCDYLSDDVVVKIHGDDDTLYVFAMQSEINPDYCYIGEPHAEQGECIALDDIRHATIAEIQANRRLTDAELSQAEVS